MRLCECQLATLRLSDKSLGEISFFVLHKKSAAVQLVPLIVTVTSQSYSMQVPPVADALSCKLGEEDTH